MGRAELGQSTGCQWVGFIGPRSGPHPASIYMYKRGVCLSVCLFVCLDLEAKLLDGYQPNLAWATHWYLWVSSKYFFGLTPPGGYNFGKTKK